jgi:hypothetical protein
MLGIFCTTTFVFLKSPARTITKFLLVPIAFAASAVVPLFFVLAMGYSVTIPMPEKFYLIAHKTLVVENKKAFIELWIRDEVGTRLYKISYSKEMEQQLERAAKGREQGLEGKFSFKKDRKESKPGSNNGSRGEWSLELLEPAQIMPKDGVPQVVPGEPEIVPNPEPTPPAKGQYST